MEMGNKNWDNDYYTKKAKAENYNARSVYKLIEIDKKFSLFNKKNIYVLDLGCAPGSWLQYAVKKTKPSGHITGIDLTACQVEGASTIKGDINNIDTLELNTKFDIVMSDMAPQTSGHKFTDSQMSLELARTAWEKTKEVLKAGGSFICKIFQGEDSNLLFKEIKPSFKQLSRFKPQTSRDISNEIFFIGKDFIKT